MSATPLPSLPVTPSTPPASAPPARPRAQQSGTSFNTHLQSAQQQQSSSTESQNNDTGQNGNGAQNASAQSGTAASGTTKPGDTAASSAAQDQTSDNGGIGIDLTGSVGTLANAVLSLIDHATGDTHGGSTGAANGAQPKHATQTGTRQAAAVQPTVPVAAMIPVVQIPANITPTTGSNAPTTDGGTSPIGNALSTSQKSSTAGADFSANAGDANTGDTGGSTSADASSLLQGAADSAQAIAGSVAATSHAALPAAASATSDSTSQNTIDMTALGNLAATAPIVPSGTSATGAHNLSTNAPVGSSGFAKELGQQITWLSGQEVKQAQIRLNPQDLGPLDVKVSVEHGRVDVAFMTQHPAATAAVQQGLDQLNQMLGGQGLSLGHATVGQHAQQQFGAQQGQQAQASGDASDEAADTPVATATRVAVGLVDAFA